MKPRVSDLSTYLSKLGSAERFTDRYLSFLSSVGADVKPKIVDGRVVGCHLSVILDGESRQVLIDTTGDIFDDYDDDEDIQVRQRSNPSSMLCSLGVKVRDVKCTNYDFDTSTSPLTNGVWALMKESGLFIGWSLSVGSHEIAKVILMSCIYEGKLSHKIVYMECREEYRTHIYYHLAYELKTRLNSHCIYCYSSDLTKVTI